MSTEHPLATPWERPAEPDHPMVVEGGVVPGDTAFMFRCLVEELLRAGIEPKAVRDMSRDGRFQALFAARVALGEETVERTIREASATTGLHRASAWEFAGSSAPATLTVSAAGPRGGGTPGQGD